MRRAGGIQTFEQSVHLGLKLLEIHASCRGPCHKNVVSLFHLPKQRTDAFSEAALGTVADYSNAHFFVNRKAHLLVAVADVQQGKILGGYPLTPTIYIGKLPVGA